MDAEDVTMLGVSGSTYRFRVDGDAPDLRAGNIIVAGGDASKGAVDKSLPDTFLRTVTSVVQDGTEMIVETAEAAVTDAVDACDLTEIFDLEMPSPEFLLPGVTRTENGLSFDEIVLWNGYFVYYFNIMDPFNSIAGNLEIRASDGYVNMESTTLDWVLAIASSEVTDCTNVYESRVEMGCDLYIDAIAELNWALDPIELYRGTQRKVTMVGWFPVVHVITTTVTFEFELFLGGGVQVTLDDLSAEFDLDAGAIFGDGDWEYTDNSSVVINIPEPALDGYARLRVKPYAVIKVEDRFYGVGGPNIRAEPYVQVETSINSSQWCLDIDVGCDVGCGASMSILDDVLDLSWDSPGFNLIDATLFHDCWALLAAEEVTAESVLFTQRR